MPTSPPSGEAFRVGVTPDFYIEAKGKFESIVEAKFGSRHGLEWAPMPAQPTRIAEAEAVDQFDAIFALALKFTAESVKGIERLAVVSRWGVGYDMIDVPALTEADVALAITPGAVRRPVAEAIFSLLFALTTNLVQQDNLVRKGGWRGDLPKLGHNIAGRTLGSIGCGNIGQEMFRMAASLGFGRLITTDPFIGAEQAEQLGVELVPMEALLAASDFVTINTPLSAETKGLIGEVELRKMKPSAYLINTARGPIVQETALIRALEEGWIAGAGLDVFEVEPLPADSPLRNLDNVILTPHGLAWTEELARDNGLEACENILTIAAGQVPASIVNKEVLNRPGFQRKLERYRRSA